MPTSRKINGRKLKELRLSKKLSQEELADLLGVDRQYVSKYEKGKVNMTCDYIDRILRALNTKPKDFH
jgi:transcriptional regulator with XRE-family HTH domain